MADGNRKRGRGNGAPPPNNEQARETITVARRCFVHNLSWDVSWQDLKDFFQECGTVVYADVMKENGTGRSKGCGIVEFDHPQAAARAIRDKTDALLKGRPILVREDREDRDLGGGGGRR